VYSARDKGCFSGTVIVDTIYLTLLIFSVDDVGLKLCMFVSTKTISYLPKKMIHFFMLKGLCRNGLWWRSSL